LAVVVRFALPYSTVTYKPSDIVSPAIIYFGSALLSGDAVERSASADTYIFRKKATNKRGIKLK
jgi:hypothetical protein